MMFRKERKQSKKKEIRLKEKNNVTKNYDWKKQNKLLEKFVLQQ